MDVISHNPAEPGLRAAVALCDRWQDEWGDKARSQEGRYDADMMHAMATAAAILKGLMLDEIAIGRREDHDGDD